LQRGKLLAWPEEGVPAVTSGRYYLYQSPASLNNPLANDFREWLVQKVKANKNAGYS
ncbi:MAG: hypothetical protein GY727_11385, partial [Gammaproteobacteria bacterium]|nr:hypothetical protein [Gammaproteobacteria bacterium]